MSAHGFLPFRRCAMYMDVIDLKDFYATALGQVARRLLAHRLRKCWPDVRGEKILGFGFTPPFLRSFYSEAGRVLAFMPAGQGVARWPVGGANVTALVDEHELPLGDGVLDRILVVHGLEMAASPHDLLREFWRVLRPGGRLLVVVPNRGGLWARVESTPFGHGRPFSRGQLARGLKNALFSPVHWQRALFAPPLRLRMLLGSVGAWERAGLVLWPHFSGVIIAEAVKDVYGAALSEGARPARVRFSPVPVGAPALPRDDGGGVGA